MKANCTVRRNAVPSLFVVTTLLMGTASGAVHAQSTEDPIEAAVQELTWRNIGPTIMGGRISDLAVVESDPSTFYVGTATGGVWKTINHGTTFESVFDDQATASIGDVTVAPSNRNVVWVGTGEPQNRQSSPWGNGVYRSTDAGRTWEHVGLEATHHIARIQVHPDDPDVAYVAAVGKLWGPNPERGVYRTVDGGRTWDLVLFIDDDTGAIDLAMDPSDPQTLFAAMYQRRRTAWGFNGGGPGSGIYRTMDGGETWEELTEGLPAGDKGRIGLAIYRGDPNLVFAIVEADARRPGQGFGGGGGARENGVYRSTDRGETWEQTSTTNNRPMYYSQIRIDPNDPERVYTGGSDLFRSSDGGRTFTDDAADGVHLDHHALWIDPADSEHMILGSDGGVSVTWDRGESWRQLRNLPVAQFYEIGVDMREPYHVCGGLQDNGSWCAPSDTWSDQGIRTRDWYNVGSGDGFFTVMHPTEPVMYAESQGGNLTRVNLITKERTRMRPVDRPAADDEDREFRWNWDTPVIISHHDPRMVFIGGNVVFKSTDEGLTWTEISPDLTRSIDREELEIMGVSGSEPMMSANDGQSSYGNLTALAESALDPELLYTGSDDGLVHVTRDGGATWTDVTQNFPGLPERTYVTRIVASRHDPGTVYAAMDGHRNDDFRPYVYVSRDHGQSWRPIVQGLPETSVNALAEHPRTSRLLFVGNETGVYFSIDGGGAWHRLANDLPTVPVDDIVIHPRENDLVVGTHGRGIWIMSDIAPLERLSAEVLAAEAHLFPVRPAVSYNPYTPQGWTPGVYAAPNPPAGALIRYYLREAPAPVAEVATEDSQNGGPSANSDEQRVASGVTLTVVDANGQTVRDLDASANAGVNEVVWDLRLPPPYEEEDEESGGGGFFGAPRGPRVLPGSYTVRLDVDGSTHETDVLVRLDPRVQISAADLQARQDAMMSAHALAKPVYEAGRAIRRLREQLSEAEALLREQDEAPQNLAEEVDTLQARLDAIDDELGEVRSGSRGAFAIEGSTTRPTADQVWQIEEAWEALPGVLDRLNEVITTSMPDLYRMMDENGVRPDPGEPVAIPRRRG